jgi:hypothetical protein
MAFADVQRQAASPFFGPSGIGGDSNTIWHNDYVSDQIYELDVTPAPATITGASTITGISTITL